MGHYTCIGNRNIQLAVNNGLTNFEIFPLLIYFTLD